MTFSNLKALDGKLRKARNRKQIVNRPKKTILQLVCIGAKSTGSLRIGSRIFRCSLGRSGRAVLKTEGDGTTPRGKFPLRALFYRSDRKFRPISPFPSVSIDDRDGWCDDSRCRSYNRPITMPATVKHERMLRNDRLYDVIIPLGFNDRNTISGRGSAIFFHLAKEGYGPTEGCIAVSPEDMWKLRSTLSTNSWIYI